MSFLYPGFLWALALLSIPIAIHLFHFRRYKTILFPDLRFLKNILTERKNRNTLKHLLVLFARCAALVCLVLAFAIPGCGTKPVNQGKKHVILFIDNSYSMNQRGNAGILFETAKTKAREIIKSYENNAEFGIVSHNHKQIEASTKSATDALKYIDELNITSASGSFKKVWNNMRQQTAFQNAHIYFISDFQNSFLREIPALDSSDNAAIFGVDIQYDLYENISIDSAWLGNPFAVSGEKNKLWYTLHNYSEDDATGINVKLELGGGTAGLGQLQVLANSTATGSLDFVMPAKEKSEAKLSVEDEQLIFDNELYLGLTPRSEVNVDLIVSNNYVESALQGNPFFKLNKLSNLSNLRMQTDACYFQIENLISANQVNSLSEFTNQGGQAIVFPSTNTDNHFYKSMAEKFGLPIVKSKSTEPARLGKDGLSHPFYSQVFHTVPKNIEMPTIKNYFSTAGIFGNGECILKLENGDPFLLKFTHGKGSLYLFLAPLSSEAGNFYQSVLFFPTISNCAIGDNNYGALFGIAGSNTGFKLRKKFNNIDGNLKLKHNNTEWLPEVQFGTQGQELYLSQQLDEAGYYYLFDKKNPTQSEVVALNISRVESDPTPAQKSRLDILIKNTGLTWVDSGISSKSTVLSGSTFNWWKLFVWLAACFFTFEVLLLVFWDPVSIFVSRYRQPTINE